LEEAKRRRMLNCSDLTNEHHQVTDLAGVKRWTPEFRPHQPVIRSCSRSPT
jgi:hypothetical protein